ncbi:MAG: polymer-forming cytoskeletal protein [Sphingomonas sp.]|jgi:cytoskeletal protein CcmA (bactofilin family)|uniref:bactofilin family protein n=1 Tax=Sphingomonas sp. TaxID=28214 RepID=UPI0035650957
MSMFNNSNKGSRDLGISLPPAPAPQPNAAGKRGMFSVLGPDVTITGNVTATADLHIDGRVDGDVNCGSIVQGTESRINGSVKADVARLAGSIEGSVSVRQLTIERAARITGDVEYETIAIENGASIDGRLKHIAADAGARNFERSAPTSAPDISLVSSNGEAA